MGDSLLNLFSSDTGNNKTVDAFKRGIASELDISKSDVDKEIPDDTVRILKDPQSDKITAFQSGKRIASSIRNLSIRRVVREYAKGIRDTTGKPLEEVLESNPVKNFRKKLL